MNIHIQIYTGDRKIVLLHLRETCASAFAFERDTGV